MTPWDDRTATLLANARTLRSPTDAKGNVRKQLAKSLALASIAGTALTAKATPLATAKLASAFKAGCAVAPTLGSGTVVGAPLVFLAPLTVGIALGISALTPNTPELIRPRAEPTQSQFSTVQAPRRQPHAPRPPIAPVVETPKTAASTVIEPVIPPVISQTSTPLARQSELLEHARLVLRQGDPTLALRSIETYRKEFPNGAFFTEALSLQAASLCRLGRISEGRAIQKRLEAIGASPATLRLIDSYCNTEVAQ
jgi:hypothetical protein